MPDALRSTPSPLVRVHREVAALAGLARPWDALVDDDAPGAVFLSPEWTAAWWEAFSARRELHLVTVDRGGAPVAVLPAYRARGPLGLTTLRLLGDGIVGSDHLGLVARGGAAEAASAIAARLLDEEQALIFDGVREDDPLLAALVAGAAERRLVHSLAPLLPCPLLDVTAAGDFERWLATRPRGAGAQLHRRRRWLERRPGYRLEIAEREDEVAAALEALIALHDARWAADGGSDGIAGEGARRFHRAVAPRLARRGQARVYVLHVEGAPRAALYGLARGPRFSFYQSGLDPEWRARSVGTVVLGAALEDTFRRGLGEFDFLRGGELYKSTFASSSRRVMRLRIARGARARATFAFAALGAAARGAARAVLPASTVESLRRARRRRGGGGGP